MAAATVMIFIVHFSSPSASSGFSTMPHLGSGASKIFENAQPQFQYDPLRNHDSIKREWVKPFFCRKRQEFQ